MIEGFVNINREAVIPLTVIGSDGIEHQIEAVVDTGFTGYLTLYPSLIASLGLNWLGVEQAILGDGNPKLFDVYRAAVIWDGHPRTVEVDAADTVPLIGMSLIYGYDLRVQVVSGGIVTIKTID